MSFVGHCNCESIRMVLAEKPAGSTICHCSNCKRSGGSAFSANYVVRQDSMTIEDPSKVLKTYKDENTRRETVVERSFCSNCGSPVVSISHAAVGLAFVKASLFGNILPPVNEVFEDSQEEWVQVAVH